MKKLLLIFLPAVLLFSCNSSNDPDPVPTSGNITGSVLLFNESSGSVSPAGMKVSVENLVPEKSALTNAEGKFTLENVPFGTYTLIYEKSGYGLFKKPEIEHKSTSTPITDSPSLGQLSTSTVTEFSATKSGTSIETSLTTSPAGNSSNRRYVRYFFSDSPNVSATNYKGFSATFIVQDAPYTKIFTAADLTQIGISATVTVYIRAYGDSFFSNSYLDPVTKKTVFPNLNPTTVGAASVTF
jgi:hypothetical protein